MYRKIVWCYILVLTLVDISLKNKLTALGNSHDMSANGHGALADGFSYHDEWGDSMESSLEAMTKMVVAEKEAAALGMRLEPPLLDLGSRPLGEAHRALVTLFNTGPDVLHLASVAGTTPDFHASFFEDKSVGVGGNTTFSVVFVGLRLGAARDALLVQSSRGVARYGVQATAGPPTYGLWPLIGLRCPDNASVSVPLHLANPTSETLQVTEVYSSGSWLSIELSGGAGSLVGAAWAVSGGARTTLAQLVPAPRGAQAAWVRVSGPGLPATLLLPVEGRQRPPGIWVDPPQLRLSPAGATDPPHSEVIRLGNSHDQQIPLTMSVSCVCRGQPHQPPQPPAAPTPAHLSAHGVTITPLAGADIAQPHQPLTDIANVTFHFGEMWSSLVSEYGSVEEGWCSGWLWIGDTGLPYSVRVMDGGVSLTNHIRVVREDRDAMQQRELRLVNGLRVPLTVIAIELGPLVDEYFNIEDLSGVTVPAGEELCWSRVALKDTAPSAPLDSWIAIRTNASRYAVDLRAYSGRLTVRWEWPWSGGSGHVDGQSSPSPSLSLGALSLSSTGRVRLSVRNPSPLPLCARALHVALASASASVALPACHGHRSPDHACRCVEPGGSLEAVLTVVAPAREGWLRGELTVGTDHGTTTAQITARAMQGRVRIRPLRLGGVAPFAPARAPLVLDNSMPVTMTLLAVEQPSDRQDPALTIQATLPLTIGPGVTSAGWVNYSLEQSCAPNCYTGLGSHAQQWAARVDRAAQHPDEVIAHDRALLEDKYRLFQPKQFNVTVLLHTSEVALVKGWGAVWWIWPRLSEGVGEGDGEAEGETEPLVAAVGGSAALTVLVTNPTGTPLLLQPVIAQPHHTPNVSGSAWSPWCVKVGCSSRASAFSLGQWQAAKGAVTRMGGSDSAPLLLLGPGARLKLTVNFRPSEQLAMAAGLYLRNNLTVVEAVGLGGRGAEPRLSLDGMSPHKGPLLFEVLECGTGSGSGGSGGGGVSVRTVVARNEGLAPLRLAGWAVAGQGCSARGFTLRPCEPLLLQPNDTHLLTITFATDYSLSLVTAMLTVYSDAKLLSFALKARVSTAVIEECMKCAPRPPWEAAMRAAGCLVAAAAAAMVLAAGAMDAERVLRRARAARAARQPGLAGRPLDLRAGPAVPAPPPAPAPPPPPRPARRRRRKAIDPAAESKAFDRWRQELGLHTPTDDAHDDKQSPEQTDADEDAGSTGSSELSSSPAEQDDNDNDHEHEDDDHDHDEDHDDHREDDDNQAISSRQDGYEPHESDEHHASCAAVRRETPPPPYSAVGPAAAVTVPLPCSPRRRRLPSRRAPRLPRRAAPSPPLSAAAPLPTTVPAANGSNGTNGNGNGGNNGNNSGGVRWGASWSSVVVGAPPPPPVPPRRPSDHSLFYFNGPPDTHYRWEAPKHAHRPFADYLEEKSPSPGPVGAPVGTKSYGPWSGLDPVGRANLDPVGRSNLDTVVRSTIDPMGRSNLDPMSRGMDSVGRSSNLDPVGHANLDCVRGNLDPVVRGFDCTNRVTSNPVVRNNLDASSRSGLDHMSLANLEASRGRSNVSLGNIDQVGRILDPVGRANSNPLSRGNLDIGQGNLDPVGRGSANALSMEQPPPPLGWSWLRPPPGFAPATPPTPPRAYDPFQSMAAIWSRNALDWRDDDDQTPPQSRSQHQQQQ